MGLVTPTPHHCLNCGDEYEPERFPPSRALCYYCDECHEHLRENSGGIDVEESKRLERK